MLVKAYAKINLFLDVIGERPNGYHDVSMIMQSVGIHDVLNITKNNSTTIGITCQDSILPCDDSNLIYKAYKKICEHTGRSLGVDIALTKNIPIAAGMAGGSTDAAATLVGLNKLFELGLTTSELCDIGVTIGADVPFCIVGGTYRCEGIGEILTPIKASPDICLVVAKPDISVSTKYVYDNLVLNEETLHPSIEPVINAIISNDINELSGHLFNQLETVTVNAYEVIDTLKKLMIREGAIGSLMSGSGPTVFGIFPDEDTATKALSVLHDEVDFRQGFVTTLRDHGIEIVE